MYNLTEKQKKFLRRLTQRANRRITTADKKFRAEGREILPRSIAGKYQVRDRWETKTNPLSASTKFESRREYQARISMLRDLANTPTYTEFARVEQRKITKAVKTSFGRDLPPDLEKRLAKMTPPQLAEFWSRYSARASQLGLRYSSAQAMKETMEDFFSEDINYLMEA